MTMEKRYNPAIGLAVALIATIVYANSLGNGFVWDDDAVIVANPALKNTVLSLFSVIDTPQESELTPYYRPVTLLTFVAEQRLHGLDPFFVRLFNVLLHAANSFLVYRLARTLLRVHYAALLAGLLFAVHPLNSEGVDFNAGGRNTMLACLFVLAAYLLHRRSVIQEKVASALAGSVLFLAGLFSKEVAVAILPFIGFLEFPALRGADRVRTSRAVARLLPYAGCIIVYLLLRSNALSSAGVHLQILPGLGSRLIDNLYIIPRYLLSVAWPVALSPKYFIPDNLHTYALPLVVAWAFILMSAWWCFTRGRSRATLFGLAWLTAFWLPISGVIPIPSAQLADRYLYIPAIGLWIGVGDQVFRLRLFRQKKKRFVFYAAGLVLLLLAALTVRRNLDWKNDVALFSRYVEQYPEIAFGHHNLGCAYLDKVKDLNLAEREFEKALALDPFFPKLSTQMGYVKLQRGDYEGALSNYTEAVKLNPLDAEAHLNSGIALEKLARYPEAVSEYRFFLSIPRTELAGSRSWVQMKIIELQRK